MLPLESKMGLIEKLILGKQNLSITPKRMFASYRVSSWFLNLNLVIISCIFVLKLSK